MSEGNFYQVNPTEDREFSTEAARSRKNRLGFGKLCETYNNRFGSLEK
jgi:hypothetical protein